MFGRSNASDRTTALPAESPVEERAVGDLRPEQCGREHVAMDPLSH